MWDQQRNQMPNLYMDSREAGYEGKTTKWLNVVIPRSYSYKEKIKEIVNDQKISNMTTISIRGREDTGKTELATGIAHMLHTELNKLPEPKNADQYEKSHYMQIKKGYVVKLLTVDDLKNFRNLIESLPLINRILIFDDISFTKINQIKHDLTTIRHLKTVDVKTVLIYNIHYSKGTDTYLRDTNYIFQTSISNGEIKNLTDLFSSTPYAYSMLRKYLKMYIKFKANGKLTVNLSKKNQKPALLTIPYSKPFRLGLFTNAVKMQFILFPQARRLGIEKCATCNQQTTEARPEPGRVYEWLLKKFSKRGIDKAFSTLSLMKYGYDVRDKGYSTALNVLLRLERNNIITPDEILAEHYNINLDAIQNSRPKRPSIPTKLQFDFLNALNLDGLCAVGNKPRTREEIQETFKEALDKENGEL